jgi:hypothetical protein
MKSLARPLVAFAGLTLALSLLAYGCDSVTAPRLPKPEEEENDSTPDDGVRPWPIAGARAAGVTIPKSMNSQR